MTVTDESKQTANGKKDVTSRLSLKVFAEQTNARIEKLELATAQKTLANYVRLLFIVVLIVGGAFFIATVFTGTPLFIKTPTATQKILAMSQKEHDMFRTAVSLVLNDINEYSNIGTALTALYSELPDTIRDQVIERLGTVKSVDDLPDAIEAMLGRVIITGRETADSRRQTAEEKKPDIQPIPDIRRQQRRR
jgi:hypothetical protein